MARPAGELQPKHWKALELFEEGVLSIRDIGKACQIDERSIYELFEGDAQRQGQVAHLFKSELDKITARTSAKIKTLSKNNQFNAHILLDERLKELKKNKVLTKEESLEVVKIMGVLNKATPSVEIGSMSFTKGLTAEELRGEFTRLTALAEQAVKSGGIRSLGAGGSGSIPELAPGRNRIPEE